MTKKKWSTIIAAALTGLVLVGCSSSPNTDNDSAESNDTASITTFGELTTLDSAVYDDVPTSDVIGQVFEGLYRVKDGNTVEPGVADEPEVSDDGLVYTFKVKDNANWTNGDPVTAEDFVYTYKKLVDPAEGNVAQSADVFKNAKDIREGNQPVENLGVKALDDKTLEITLEYPAPYLSKLLTGTRFLPQHQATAEKEGEDYGTSADKIVSNGPFKIEGWTGSETSWKLLKNKDYWDADNVKLNEVDIVVSKEVSTGANLFEAGDVDYTVLTDEYVAQNKENERFHTQPKALIGYLGFNVSGDITGNVHVRRAIGQAYDKEAYVNQVLQDGSIALNGQVPSNFAKNDQTGDDFRDDSGDLLTYNVEAAQEEWEKAKEELGQDEITLEIITSDTGVSKTTGEYLQDQLERNLPGLSVSLKNVPLKNRLDLQRNLDYDIFYGTWTPDYQDPLNFLEQYQTDGGINFSDYSNSDYDALVQKVRSDLANEPEQRWDALLELDKKLIQEDTVVAPIYQGSQAYLLDDRLKGLEILPFGRTINLRTAYVE
ncbi:peptide ABC transporter substrate-binding protein [Bavariicoccus seileri]|uniref:peptide ABC transporter substrate-binding protein n=1 Tax=Bavariicoccus seileri TaxID=549685 RepID=UPI003F8E3025